MYAQLGDIYFESLLTPTEHFTEASVTNVLLEPINGRPITQSLGLNAKTMQIKVFIHKRFYSDPMMAFEIFEADMNNRTPLPLLWGDGRFDGYYLIDSLRRTELKRLPTGEAIALELLLNLTGYYGRVKATPPALAPSSGIVPLVQQQAIGFSNSFVMANNPAISLSASAMASSNQVAATSASISKLRAGARFVVSGVKKIMNGLNNARQATLEARKALDFVRGSLDSINAAKQRYETLKDDIDTVKDLVQGLSLSDPNVSLMNLYAANELMTRSSESAAAAAAPLYYRQFALHV